MSMEQVDILIVGGGPAGLTAAIYARRAGKSVLVLERNMIGGQIALSARVDNFPGCSGISGQELADKIYNQVLALDARVELEEVLQIQDGNPKIITTDCNRYQASNVILATGMRHRSLGLPREEELPGVSFCAVCDGAFYTGKDVAVCGGGNTAIQDALFLAEICRQVTLIHRREQFRGDSILLHALKSKTNIKIRTNTIITALHGQEALTGITLQDIQTGQTEILPVSGFFQAIGQIPETGLRDSSDSLGRLSVDQNGFFAVGEDCRTNIAGIFTAGDCRAKPVRQLTTACSDGAIAALVAAENKNIKNKNGVEMYA